MPSLGYIFSGIMWAYLHSNFRCRLRKRHVLCNEVRNGRSRSLILVPIESAYATSYESSMVTLVLSCPISEISQISVENSDPTPIHPNFGGVPLD